MAHVHDPAPRTVYCIIDPERSTFYVNKTHPHRVGKAYSEHINGRVRKTRQMFENSDTPPPLYILEESEMTNTVAFRHSVAWTKYFLDQGFVQAWPDILTEYASDMIPETQRIYDNIKDKPLDEVLAPGKMLPPPRGKMHKEKSDCVQFSIRFSPQEYAKVTATAKEHNFPSTTAYCKHMAITGRVIELDLSLILEWISYYRDIRTLLRQILLSVYKSGKYYPADMANIQKCIDRMGDYLSQALEMSNDLILTISRDGYEDISDV